MSELLAVDDGTVPANVVAFPAHAPGHDEPEVRAANGSLLSAILRQDEDNEIRLTEKMNRLRDAISMLGQGFSTARGYAAAHQAQQAGHCIDIAG
jgi:hypothetical protein